MVQCSKPGKYKSKADLSLLLMILYLSGMHATQFKDIVPNFIIFYTMKDIG